MAIAQAALLVVVPLYVLELGDSPAVAALVFAMRGLGSVAANLPASVVIDRYGHRAGMIGAVGLMGLSALLLASTGSSWVAAAATLAFGAGMGGWLLARLALITHLVPNHQRGTALSGLAGLQRLGMLAGPLLGGAGVATVGHRVVFLAVVVTALVAVALVRVFAPARIGDADRAEPEPSSDGPLVARGPVGQTGLFAQIPAILRQHRRIFLTAGLYAFSLQLLREQRNLLFVLWGTGLGIAAGPLGGIISLAAALDMVMFPFGGWVIDHWGRKPAGLGCIGLLALALGLLPLTTTAVGVAAVALLAAVGNGLGSGIILTMGADLAPRRDTSRFLGVWRMVGDVGALSGPLLTSAVGSVVVALGVSAAIGAAGGVVLWRLVDETLSVRER